jgi:hypothetical protein
VAEAESAPTMVTHRFYFQYGAYVPDDYMKDVKRPEDFTFKIAANLSERPLSVGAFFESA